MTDRGPAPEGAENMIDDPATDEERIEAELISDPDRPNTKIARVYHVPVMAVRQVRERLGAYPTKPS